MKQHEAVIQTLARLGGQATLADLYIEVMKVPGCQWKTKTPFASIRRIVQTRPEVFRVRPGLRALRSQAHKLGLSEKWDQPDESPGALEQGHSYYQGLLVIIGNLRGYGTFVPNQDKNKLFVSQPLKSLRSLQVIPSFTYDPLLRKASTVDVIWFNDHHMPHSLFEVEHATDIQNSLLKFDELRDFAARMVIVADEHRRREYEQKLQLRSFTGLRGRVSFLTFNYLVNQYESEVRTSSSAFTL